MAVHCYLKLHTCLFCIRITQGCAANRPSQWSIRVTTNNPRAICDNCQFQSIMSPTKSAPVLCVVICSQILSLSTDFKSVNSSKSTKKSNRNQLLSDKDQFDLTPLSNSLLSTSVRDELPRDVAQHIRVRVQHVPPVLGGAGLRVPSAATEAAHWAPDLRGRVPPPLRPGPRHGGRSCWSPQPRASVPRPRSL